MVGGVGQGGVPPRQRRWVVGGPEVEHLHQPGRVDLRPPRVVGVAEMLVRRVRVVGRRRQGRHQATGAAVVADQREGAVVGTDVDRVVDACRRPGHPLEDGLDPRPQVVHRPVPGGVRVRHHLLPCRPVVEGVVDDPVPPGTDPREGARVVDERHRGKLRDGPAPQRDSAREQPRDVRQLARSGQCQDLRGGRPVPQQADHPAARRGRQVDRHAVQVAVGASGESRQRGTDVDGADGAVEDAAGRHTGTGQHEGGARLQRTERAVLAEVAAALRPVMGVGVHHREVRRARVAEQRVQPLRGKGVRRVRQRVLVGDRVHA